MIERTTQDRLALESADLTGLDLNVVKNDLCEPSKVLEDAQRVVLLNERNPVNNYLSGYFGIRLLVKYGPRTNPADFHLVFIKVPSPEVSNYSISAVDDVDATSGLPHGLYGHRCNERMFIGIGEFVQGPEEVIPSAVWCEPAHHLDDLWGDLFASPLYYPLKAYCIISEGKEVSFPANREHCLIQGVTAIDNGIERIPFNILMQRLDKFDFLNMIAGIGVFLDNNSVWATFEELDHPTLEICGVLIAPLNGVF